LWRKGIRLRELLSRGTLRKEDGMEKGGKDMRRLGGTVRETEEGRGNGKGEDRR
jgi:hypothetical protein